MELTEDFLKLITIAIAIVGVLSIFFIFIQYNVIICYEDSHKTAVVLGDTLLSNGCLVETDVSGYPIKGLFLESKINSLKTGGEGACDIKSDAGTITIQLLENLDTENLWIYTIGPSLGRVVSTEKCVAKDATANYVVAIKMIDGEVKLANMKVKL
ncbi:MAG: hypothetical protein KJ906_00235 [Nanoarchaeota archaeon]|nr:hypothetical protein [Nanoarchaeota archaeon]